MNVNVSGGTNAGWRHVYPPTVPWFCQKCDKTSRYRRCIGCGGEQPKE